MGVELKRVEALRFVGIRVEFFNPSLVSEKRLMSCLKVGFL